MKKTYVVLAITAVASVMFVALPETVEHLGNGLHFVTVVVSVNHIFEEIIHCKQAK